jgi:hypothetical protein
MVSEESLGVGPGVGPGSVVVAQWPEVVPGVGHELQGQTSNQTCVHTYVCLLFVNGLIRVMPRGPALAHVVVNSVRESVVKKENSHKRARASGPLLAATAISLSTSSLVLLLALRT